MSGIPHWSIILDSQRGRRTRWLGVNGRFSSNASLALRLVSSEVAARRVQQYMQLHGWPPEVMDRFRLVPAPPVDPLRQQRSRLPLGLVA